MAFVAKAATRASSNISEIVLIQNVRVMLSNVRNTYAAACMSCIGKIAIDKLVNQFLTFSTYDVPPTLLDADPPVSHSHGMFCFAFLAVMKF